jgi:hypothetical protein
LHIARGGQVVKPQLPELKLVKKVLFLNFLLSIKVTLTSAQIGFLTCRAKTNDCSK